MKSINPSNRNVPFARYSSDAMLLTEFERSVESGRSFNYSRSVASAPQSVPGEQITAYLTKIQRGGLIQSFGCMLAIEEPSFRILAYSENAIDFLDVETDTEEESKQLKGLLGVDARTLFTPSSGPSLAKAVASRELSLLNPIWVESRSTQKPFYAIVHRIDVGMVIDLEPVPSDDPALSLVGAVQSQKLAVRAISRLQSLPAGDVGALFDAVVEDVQKLTGYDRVMVYKFHDDDYGEVVSEIRRSDLEPYLGLHYPATDVPQAARFLFKQNRVRMICDCNSSPVRVIQSEELKQPLGLVNSTLRSPHACHTQFMSNMGSIASLAMAVVISANDLTRLWGLVVCHHTSPRYVPYPLRYACEFLMGAFGLQLYLELQLISQMEEKNILRMQTILCDMLLRDVPSGIVTQSPNIMDLVKCDGAALFYGGRCWLVGITPTEAQVKDIAAWLLQFHEDSTGLSTDCLSDSGYLRAALLGDAVCGMATARITSKDFLFWFRSHTAKEVRWGGAKHHPEDKDDDGRMNPGSSFKAFLEVVKGRSLPWEDSELNAIHSLQLILRGSFQDIEDRKRVEALIHAQKNNVEMKGLDELGSAAYELARMIETATVPILAVDSAGLINGWNSKTAELTGLHAKEALGKSLVKDIVHEDSRQAIENHLLRALQGEEHRNVELKLRTFGLQQQNPTIFIAANACTSRDYTNSVVGVCFVGQDVTEEKVCMDKFIRLQGDYKAMVQSVNPLIPPIFASDENSCCSEWNAMMEKLTGWTRKEVIGKMILGEVFGGLCKLKDKDTLVKFMILLYRAIGGQDTENFPLVFFDREGKYVEVLLTANRRTDIGGNVIGCFCFLRTVVPNLQSAVEGQKEEEKKYFAKLKELVYIQQEAKNPLNGILFAHKLLENTTVTEDQKQFLDTIYACERQMARVLEDMEFGRIEGGCLELNMVEFNLKSVIDAIINQAMILLREKHLQLILQIPEEIKTLTLYGDEIRLQQVLSDFLLNIVHYTPTSDGWAEIMVAPGLKLKQDGIEFIHLQFRMTHAGHGLPSALVQNMFEVGTQLVVQESYGLNLSRKLLNKMNGNIQYVREPDKCYFIIDLKLQTKQNAKC